MQAVRGLEGARAKCAVRPSVRAELRAHYGHLWVKT